MAQRIPDRGRHNIASSVGGGKGDGPSVVGGHPEVLENTLPRRSRSRQSHNRDEERIERQRREEQYQKWQSFKAKQRGDKHAALKQKLALQQQLIQAQDELHFQRQVQEERRQSEICEAKRQERRQIQESLTQRGKIDLESERREARTKRRAARKLAAKLQQASLEPADKQEGPVHAGAAGPGVGRRLSVAVTGRGEPRSGRLSVVSSSDEDGDDDDDGGENARDEEDGDVLPHQQDLYQIFGRKQAAYFLRPRIEPEQKKVVPVPQSIRRQGGRAGVTALWGTLRDRSTVKLQKADSEIPQELKAAYGAFVRECLTNNKTVAKRSFYSEEGIPDGEQLQDGSYHQRVKDVQKKVELMYRAALTNEDKASVLLFNNPIPDYNNLKGTEGPLRYHPSWIHEGGDEEEQASYKKWLRELPSPRPQLPPLGDLPPTPLKRQRPGRNPDDDDEDDDSMSWDSLPDVPGEEAPPRTAAKERPKKLSFLTEADATVPGQFRKRWEEKRDATGRFVPGKAVMSRGSLEDVGGGDVRDTIKPTAGPSKLRSSTAPPLSSSFASQSSSGQREIQTARKDWQPLSQTALEDYKPPVHLLGGGDYAQGQELMWKPIVASATDGKH